jgi:hypothetical protein
MQNHRAEAFIDGISYFSAIREGKQSWSRVRIFPVCWPIAIQAVQSRVLLTSC